MKQRRSLETHLNCFDTHLLVLGEPTWFPLEPLQPLPPLDGRAGDDRRAPADPTIRDRDTDFAAPARDALAGDDLRPASAAFLDAALPPDVLWRTPDASFLLTSRGPTLAGAAFAPADLRRSEE